MIGGWALVLSVAILFSITCPVIRLLTQGFDEGTMQIARLATASKFPIPVTGLVPGRLAVEPWEQMKWREFQKNPL